MVNYARFNLQTQAKRPKTGATLEPLNDDTYLGEMASAARDCPIAVVNPYSYFGRADIWPRGYPLRALNHTNVDEFVNLHSVSLAGRPTQLVALCIAS